MARKTKECAEQTRNKLINAARQLFLQNGVSKTTLEQIAIAAGYTRGAIHWHFKNKMEIFIAMKNAASAPLIIKLDKTLIELEGKDQMDAIGQSIKDFLTALENDQVTRETFMITRRRCEYAGEFSELKDQMEQEERECRLKISQAFVRANELGQLRRDISPEIAEELTHSFIAGSMQRGLDEAGCMAFKCDPHEAIDAFIKILRPPR